MGIVKIRNKVTEKEAIQFDGNFEEIEAFVGGDCDYKNGVLIVATLEGPLKASNKDWIIKGLNGEFYPCKPDIFEKSYEII